MTLAFPNASPIATFFAQLRQSQLVDWATLDKLAEEFQRERVARSQAAVAARLVDRGILTPFQAERLLAGRCGDVVAGPYVLKDRLGSGCMGTAYRAELRTGSEPFAVKLIPRRSVKKVIRARRQLRSFERVRHPAIARFLDVGTDANHHYLAWEFVQGEPLRARVEREGPLSVGEAARYVTRAAEGLFVCHQHELIHGLLSPANLLATAEGDVRVLDAGIGALIAENSDSEAMFHTLGNADQIVRGLDCASPEAILEPAAPSSASDQYSLGCTLYYLLAGRFPFEGGTVAKMQAHQFETAVRLDAINPYVPKELADIAARMMGKKPEDRFPSLAEVSRVLGAFSTSPELGWVGRKTMPAPVVSATPVPESAEPELAILEPVEPETVVESHPNAVQTTSNTSRIVLGALLGFLAAWAFHAFWK